MSTEQIEKSEIKSSHTSIREVINHHKAAFHKCLKSNEDDHYQVDRNDAIDYLNHHGLENQTKKILEYIQGLKKKGEDVIYVDICGRATGESIGANKSFCLSLKTIERKKKSREENGANKFIDGDIFDSKDFLKLINQIKKSGSAPALVTFNPIVGLQTHFTSGKESREERGTHINITNGILLKRLDQILKILKPGGYVYITKPYQLETDILMCTMLREPISNSKTAIHINKTAENNNCEMEIISNIQMDNTPIFLLHKLD